MATKPRPRGRPGKPQKPEGPPKEKTQRERFIEAAREIGVDESGKEFELLFARVVRPKQGS
jgi:hypothetical protein